MYRAETKNHLLPIFIFIIIQFNLHQSNKNVGILQKRAYIDDIENPSGSAQMIFNGIKMTMPELKA